MRAKTALLAAPQVVRGPERRHRRHAWRRGCDHPADQGQPEAAVVDGGRAEGEQQVTQLAPAVREAGRVEAGRPVLEVELQLMHREAGAHGVDRHPRLDAEAGRDREAAGARASREQTLAGQRLARLEARREGDEPAGRALRQPEAAALPPREHGDDEVALCRSQRA
jgi:hypothetical protein